MWYAVFKTMFLRLLRDKGALVLAFVLPGFIFAIFAAIFADATSGQMDVNVAITQSEEMRGDAFTDTVTDALKAAPNINLTQKSEWKESDIRGSVRSGEFDAGVVILRPLSDQSGPALTIFEEGSRQIAAQILEGEIQALLGRRYPLALIERRLGLNLDDFTPAGTQGPFVNPPNAAPALIERRSTDVSGAADGPSSAVSYYVGAVIILFVLFSAMQGAGLGLEERRNGISDRLLMGPFGALSHLLGKFIFLTLQGTVQALVILIVAKAVFNVPIFAALPALLLISVASAAAAAGLALLAVSLCTSPAQMHTFSTFLVLILSAIGGSMVPRFMMPEGLQSLGWFTPNGWSIDAYYGILARGQTIGDAIYPVMILSAIAILGLWAAAIISHRMMRV